MSHTAMIHDKGKNHLALRSDRCCSGNLVVCLVQCSEPIKSISVYCMHISEEKINKSLYAKKKMDTCIIEQCMVIISTPYTLKSRRNYNIILAMLIESTVM